MDLLSSLRHAVEKHYPTEHLYLAGGLFFLLLLLSIIPGENNSSEGSTRATIAVPITVNAGQELEDISRELPAEIESEPLADIVMPPTDGLNALPEPQWQRVEVRSGDNLSAIFSKVGLTDQDVYQVLNSSEEAKVLNRLYPGYELNFMIPDGGDLQQLTVAKSPLEGVTFTRNASGYSVETYLKEAQVEQAFKVGSITDSLFMAGQREQIPAVHIMEMANIFGGVIDFILDPRAGDQFSILYEEKFLDGEFIGHGEIIATQYVNQGTVYTAVRYVDEEGETGYYNPEGESMRKAFLRNPLDVFRISSNFNPRRRHPILNTIRAHKGTDYAAPTGTPVRATSDGRVTWASRNGSFGNLIVVQHAGSFETKYAHLSRYAVRRGERVRQGDVIGYVGATGGATGPHLHYEFLMNGVHQNPRTIHDKLPKAESIPNVEMDRFKSQTAGLMQHFIDLNTRLTLNQPAAD